MPDISVVMPVYNAQKYIEKTMDCILNQSFGDYELIVIDDCGVDNSIKIIESIHDNRIKIIHNERNMGIAYSRNMGLQCAKGKYIALMDDDDLCPFNRLEIQRDFMEKHPDIDVVGGRYQIIDEDDEIIKIFPEPLNNPEYIKAYMMFYDPIANGTALIRKSFLDKYKLRYQDDCLGMEDYRFWIDCSLYGRLTNLPQIMLSWRQSTTNETSRSIGELLESRELKYAEFQKYALLRNGFELEDDEMCFFSLMFKENIRMTSASYSDLNQIYIIFKKMIKQAEHMNLRNKEEVIICLKKMFSLRLEYSEIWI